MLSKKEVGCMFAAYAAIMTILFMLPKEAAPIILLLVLAGYILVRIELINTKLPKEAAPRITRLALIVVAIATMIKTISILLVATTVITEGLFIGLGGLLLALEIVQINKSKRFVHKWDDIDITDLFED